MSKDIKPSLIRAFYVFMEMEMEGYNIYVDTPKKRFEYDPESIWIVNPKTKRWIIELEKSGELWYHYKFYDNFSMWFKEELSVFEQLITVWVEGVLKRRVSITRWWFSPKEAAVKEVLKRGVSTTNHFVGVNNMVI